MKKCLTKRNVITVVCVLVSFIIGCFVGDSSVIHRINESINKKLVDSKPNNYARYKLNQEQLFEVGETATIRNDEKEKDVYSLKINSVQVSTKKNPLVENQPEKIIIINYTYKNIALDNEKLYISDSNFKIFDENGKILQIYPSPDIRKYAENLPMGKSCDAEMAFALDNGKTLELMFYYDMLSDKPNAIFKTTLQ